MKWSEAAELSIPPAAPARTGSMAQGESKAGRRATRPAQATRGVDDAFDVWLNRGLHQLYDAVASEPLPQELLDLIEEDRKGGKPDGKEGEGQ
jgi:Anti-sigma factor NepR